MNSEERHLRNQIQLAHIRELDDLLQSLAIFKKRREFSDSSHVSLGVRSHIEEVQMVALELKRKVEENVATPWFEIKRLIERNAKHRKGFRLREVSDVFVLDQAQDELTELKDEPDDPEELADLIGILMHYAQKKDWSWEMLEMLLMQKLKDRFEPAGEIET